MSKLGTYGEITKLKGVGIGCSRHKVCLSGPGAKGGIVPCTLRDRGGDSPPSSEVPSPGPTLIPPTPSGGKYIYVGVVLFARWGWDGDEWADTWSDSLGQVLGRLWRSPLNSNRSRLLSTFTLDSEMLVTYDTFRAKYPALVQVPLDDFPTSYRYDKYLFFHSPEHRVSFNPKTTVLGFDCTIEGQDEPNFHILDWRHYRVTENETELVGYGGMFYPDPDPLTDPWPWLYERVDDTDDDWSHERGTYELIIPADWGDDVAPKNVVEDDYLYIHLRPEKYTFSCFLKDDEVLPVGFTEIGYLQKKNRISDPEWTTLHTFTIDNYTEPVSFAYNNEEKFRVLKEIDQIGIREWRIKDITTPGEHAQTLVREGSGDFNPLDRRWHLNEPVTDTSAYFNQHFVHAYLEIATGYVVSSFSIGVDDIIYLYAGPNNITELTGDQLTYNPLTWKFYGYKYWLQPVQVITPFEYPSADTLYIVSYSDQQVSQWMHTPQLTFVDEGTKSNISYWKCKSTATVGAYAYTERWHVIDDQLHETLWNDMLSIGADENYEDPSPGYWSSDGTRHTGRYCFWKFNINGWA